MSNRYRAQPTLLALVLILAACGGASAESEAPAGEEATPSPETPMETAAARTSEAAEEPPVAGGDTEWATVDLTTIDWNTIDLRTIDWEAIQDNPSAENLPEGTGDIIQSRLNPGGATLTIGDEVYEFDSFDCASGHENTESETFSFTTNSFGDFDGVRTQMQYTVEDPTSTGQTEGEGVRHRIDFDDIADFENPSISWYMREADAASIDGYDLSVSGLFDDGLTEGVIEEVAGSLDAECSDMSRF